MEFVVGQLVRSRRGRDVERLYMVLEVSKERLLLVNGDKWRLENPKKKNPLHLQPISDSLPEEHRVTDLHIKTALRQYEAKAKKKQGG